MWTVTLNVDFDFILVFGELDHRGQVPASEYLQKLSLYFN